MVKRIASLFILINFIFSFSSEVGAASFEVHEDYTVEKSVSIFTIEIASSGCEDCHDDGCDHHDSHCGHHCSGLHNLIETKQTIKLSHESIIENKTTWYFKYHYDEPFLDPAVKPPLFS